MKPYRQAILGLGSNLGDRATMLASARSTLSELPGTRLLAASPIYETEPVGLRAQPMFLNQVVALETLLSPQGLLRACLELEHEHGRVRDVLNGPRTLDIDQLFYENTDLDTPELILPHPRWQERAFVVVPLLELLDLPVLKVEHCWDALRREASGLPVREGVVCWGAH
ncbi:MAG: 2-amino-4-hydroxy-6-hydroxymethyldihydropteridine diphosphokinase [Puniceicoccales bacterium]